MILKIRAADLPPRCERSGLPAPCDDTNLLNNAVVYLQIENLFSPVSKVQNSIGFETLPPGYTTGAFRRRFPCPIRLPETMNIGMTNVF